MNLLLTGSQSGYESRTRDNFGMTPLHYAVKYGHFEVVKYIANILENPNLPNFQGKTAHSLAKEAGHVDIAGLLDSHTIALNRLSVLLLEEVQSHLSIFRNSRLHPSILN